MCFLLINIEISHHFNIFNWLSIRAHRSQKKASMFGIPHLNYHTIMCWLQYGNFLYFFLILIHHLINQIHAHVNFQLWLVPLSTCELKIRDWFPCRTKSQVVGPLAGAIIVFIGVSPAHSQCLQMMCLSRGVPQGNDLILCPQHIVSAFKWCAYPGVSHKEMTSSWTNTQECPQLSTLHTLHTHHRSLDIV